MSCSRHEEDRDACSTDVIDLDWTIEQEQQTRQSNNDESTVVAQFHRLGRLHYLRFTCCRKPEDLALAITYQHMCFDAADVDSFHRAMFHADLAMSLYLYFQHSNLPWSLQSAISNMRKAIELSPMEMYSPQRAFFHRDLGVLLSRLFQSSRDIADLDSAIDMIQISLRLTNPERSSCLMLLIGNHLLRFKHLKDMNDFYQALEYQAQAVEYVPQIKDLEERAGALDTFSMLSSRHFEKSGNVKYVEEAVDYAQRALDLSDSRDPRFPKRSNRLLRCLLARYLAFQHEADFIRAIELHHQIQSSDHYRPQHKDLHTLGRLLATVFVRQPRRETIDAAVRYLELSVSRLMNDKEKPEFARRLNDLGIARTLRYEHSQLRNEEDINKAVDNARSAVEVTPPEDFSMQHHCLCLAGSLGVRFEYLWQLEDIEEAIRIQKDIVQSTSVMQHRYHVDARHGLGQSYLRLHKYWKAIGDFKTANQYRDLGIGELRQAVDAQHGFYHDKLRAALAWAKIMHTHSDSLEVVDFACLDHALEGYDHCIDLIHRVASLGANAIARLGQLSSIPKGLASDAAACAFQLAEHHKKSFKRQQYYLQRAVELLDHGRSVLWSQAAQFRPDLELLQAQYPTLADRLRTAAQDLDARGFSSGEGSEVSWGSSAYRQEWDRTLAAVRALQGFEDFLQKPSFQSLRSAADGSTILVVNISSSRCDAVIIPPAGALRLVPLPQLSQERVEELAEHHLRGVSMYNGANIPVLLSPTKLSMSSPFSLPEPQTGESRVETRDASSQSIAQASPLQTSKVAQRLINYVLYSLWETVGEPVLQELERANILSSASSDEPPHVHWCLTGQLSFLPIHAASPRRVKGSPKKPGMLDRLASSYTPTLSALLRARKALGQSDANILAVGHSNADPDAPLPGALKEIEALCAVVGSDKVTTLINAEATVPAVSDALRCNSWVHFACHGKQDSVHPLSSALLLEGGRLSLSRILQSTVQDDQQEENAEGLMVSSFTLNSSRSASPVPTLKQRKGNVVRDFACLLACESGQGCVGLSDEAIHIAAGLHFAGFRSVIATMWSISDISGPIVTELVYKYLFRSKDGRVQTDSSEAAYALRHALLHLRDEKRMPAKEWAPFIHFGV